MSENQAKRARWCPILRSPVRSYWSGTAQNLLSLKAVCSAGEQFAWLGWRRERDSNPRYGFPQTRFPSVRLQPLGHLSRTGGAHYSEPARTGKAGGSGLWTGVRASVRGRFSRALAES